MSIVVLAESEKELDSFTDAITQTGYECGCEIQVMGLQQMAGLNTVLPYGPRYIQNLRETLLHSSFHSHPGQHMTKISSLICSSFGMPWSRSDPESVDEENPEYCLQAISFSSTNRSNIAGFSEMIFT